MFYPIEAHGSDIQIFIFKLIIHSPAAHGGRPLPMAWVCWLKCMQYTWRGTPRIALARDASARIFSTFGTLPAKLPPCQYSRTFLEEAPCRPTTFAKMPNKVGTLPKVPHLTLIVHNWPHTSLLWPKLAQKRHIFVDNWPWPLTFDLWSQKISLSRITPMFLPNIEALGQMVLPFFGAETCTNP